MWHIKRRHIEVRLLLVYNSKQYTTDWHLTERNIFFRASDSNHHFLLIYACLHSVSENGNLLCWLMCYWHRIIFHNNVNARRCSLVRMSNKRFDDAVFEKFKVTKQFRQVKAGDSRRTMTFIIKIYVNFDRLEDWIEWSCHILSWLYGYFSWLRLGVVLNALIKLIAVLNRSEYIASKNIHSILWLSEPIVSRKIIKLKR